MKKRIVRADGELRVIRRVGVPGVENGVAVRGDGTLVDITEQGTATQSRPGVSRSRGGAQSHRELRTEVIQRRIGLVGRDFSNP